MTPQQIEAMKLALEALELINIEFVCGNGSHHKKEDRHEWDEDCPITNRWRKAIIALEEALAQPEQKYRRGDRLVCLETDEYCVIHVAGTDRQWVKFPDTHIGVYTNEQVSELFEKLAKETDLAQPEQEPVANIRTWHKNGEQHAELWNWDKGIETLPDGDHDLYTTPPQRTDQKPHTT